MGISKKERINFGESRIIQIETDLDNLFQLTRVILKKPDLRSKTCSDRAKTRARLVNLCYDILLKESVISEDSIDRITEATDLLIRKAAEVSMLIDKDNEYQLRVVDSLKSLAWRITGSVELRGSGRFFDNKDKALAYLSRNL